ncbi:hypothetical protein [Pedobacter agri]|nr:hypothetical protein [Pedobacter agri]
MIKVEYKDMTTILTKYLYFSSGKPSFIFRIDNTWTFAERMAA